MGSCQTPARVLTRRETMVFEARFRGLTMKEVAAELSLSPDTTRHYVESIYRKLHVHSFQQAVLALQQQHCRTCGRGLFAHLPSPRTRP